MTQKYKYNANVSVLGWTLFSDIKAKRARIKISTIKKKLKLFSMSGRKGKVSDYGDF